MSGGEVVGVLRPRMTEIHHQSEELSTDVLSMERQLAEAIKNADRASVQLRGYAVEVGSLTHRLNSLRGTIVVLLDELDKMDSAAAPANSNSTRPAPKKGAGG